MHFKKKNVALLSLWVLMMVWSTSVSAQVDLDIRAELKHEFEHQVYYVRQDLVTYAPETEGGSELVTTFTDFVYPDEAASLKRTVVFPAGDAVMIEDVDVDLKGITLTLVSTKTNEMAELFFGAGHMLSETFEERPLFVKRFDELFMRESVKNSGKKTDTITALISAGTIMRGVPSEQLLVMLGQPRSMTTLVDATGTYNEWRYEQPGVVYRFIFRNDLLDAWIKNEQGE